jgi:hypothetical protein
MSVNNLALERVPFSGMIQRSQVETSWRLIQRTFVGTMTELLNNVVRPRQRFSSLAININSDSRQHPKKPHCPLSHQNNGMSLELAAAPVERASKLQHPLRLSCTPYNP